MYAEACTQCDFGARVKKVTGHCDSRELGKKAVAEKQASIHPPICETFGISEACCRYERRLSDENVEVPIGYTLDGTEQAMGFWSVFFVFAQFERLWLEPQACVSNLQLDEAIYASSHIAA